MAKSFDDRKKGFERKFVHDEELQFRARARGNRLFGLWAAERMGMTDADEARSYAQDLVRVSGGMRDADLVARVRNDLQAKGVEATDQELTERMAEMLAEAKAEIMREAGDAAESG